MTLTFIQYHSCIRNENFGVHFLANLMIDVDEIKWIVTSCWFVETHADFTSPKYYSLERSLLT